MEPDERQAQILHIAAQHFAQYGFDGTSMSAIAREADITRNLVYHYFPSKSALFEAVLQRESAALLEATQIQPSEHQEDDLRRALRAYFDYFSPRSGQQTALHLQSEDVSSLIRRQVQANHAIQTGRIIALLQLPDTLLLRASAAAWLDFVTRLAREMVTYPETGQQELIDLCLRVLYAAVNPD